MSLRLPKMSQLIAFEAVARSMSINAAAKNSANRNPRFPALSRNWKKPPACSFLPEAARALS